jgi:hypothetical protein
MSESQIDSIMTKLSEILERLSVVETLVKERTMDTQAIFTALRAHDQRLVQLETHRASVITAKDIVTWAAVAAIGVWGALK